MCKVLFEANFQFSISYTTKTLQFPTQSSSKTVYLSCLKNDFTFKINYRNIPGTLQSKCKMSMTSADAAKCFKKFAN